MLHNITGYDTNRTYRQAGRVRVETLAGNRTDWSSVWL